MDRAKRTDRIIIGVLAALAVLLVWWLVGFGSSAPESVAEDTASSAQGMITFEDYDGRPIGVLTGTNLEDAAKERFPSSELLYFDDYAGQEAALLAGQIDAFLGDEPAVRSIHAAVPQIGYLPGRLTNNRYSFAFRKGDPASEALLVEFDAFLARIRADGTYEKIDATWFGTDETAKVVDMGGLTGEAGTLRMAVCATDEPFCYVKDGAYAGFDVDVAVRFCRERGYALEVVDMDFPARIPAVQSGSCDFANTMNVTPERAEQVDFSEAVSEGGIVVAVRAEDLGAVDGGPEAPANIFESIAESFERNFLKEDRWKLILSGLGTTCLITVVSVALGTVLSFGICVFRRTGSRLANIISDVYVRLLQGTPTLVLLMILYYVVLARSGIASVWVAVIGFTLNFGAYGSEIMRSGIDAVGAGQREAALALGYTDRQAFHDFIFPQAAVHFLPVLRGEAVNLLKSTSVVGYIAIQDLTKMSDIIRSRTYEAFFPLIATAAIYFALAWLLALLCKVLVNRIDPRRRRGARHEGQGEEVVGS